MDGQDVNMVWELVPYEACIPLREVLDVLRVYSKCFEFPRNRGLDVVVAEGFKGFI